MDVLPRVLEELITEYKVGLEQHEKMQTVIQELKMHELIDEFSLVTSVCSVNSFRLVLTLLCDLKRDGITYN